MKLEDMLEIYQVYLDRPENIPEMLSHYSAYEIEALAEACEHIGSQASFNLVERQNKTPIDKLEIA
jgi:hypothetical protein